MPSLLRVFSPLLLIIAAFFTAVETTCTTDSDAKLGAVACENSQCSQIGINLLKEGGNAADALVGTVFCVGVIGMMHSGIGGGGFMLVRAPNGTYEFIDFREVAPAAALEDMFTNNTEASLYGGLASGVPGELRGLEYLHRHYGLLSWASVMEPAIRVARYGFRVNEDMLKYMDAVEKPNGDFFTEDPSWAMDFAPRGYRLKLNEIMTRKQYADTLEVIAHEGPDAFYTGTIAKATIATLTKANGTMTMEDLENYTIALRKPSEISYQGYKATACGAPAGGSVALSTLKVIDGLEGLGDPAQRNFTTHRLDEAIKFAYGERTKLGDPSFVEGMLAYQNSMLSDATAAVIRSKLANNPQDVSYYNPDGIENLETPGTSHIVAADRSGLAISMTTTINTLFGSQVRVPETGVIMNNQMNDFSIPGSSNTYGYISSPANYIQPGKRPLSSMSPTIVETHDGKLYLVIGAAGGSRIITSTIQNLHYILDRNMTTPQALAQPRLHDQLIPAQIAFEYAYDNSTVAYMKELGHNVTWVAPGLSEAHAVRLLQNGTFEAAGEPRQAVSGGFAI